MSILLLTAFILLSIISFIIIIYKRFFSKYYYPKTGTVIGFVNVYNNGKIINKKLKINIKLNNGSNIKTVSKQTKKEWNYKIGQNVEVKINPYNFSNVYVVL